jgi:TonB family protein
MDNEKKKKQFIPKPIYVGGVKAMKVFVAKELKYPQEALEKKIEGRVHIKYEINYRGKVVSTKVISGLGHGCDIEAKRIVSLMKFQIAEIPRKRRLKFFKKISINFKLPKEKPVKQHIKYSVSSDKKEESSSSYYYTINY